VLTSGTNIPALGRFAPDVRLRAGRVAEGFYLVAFSEFANGTRLKIGLPESVRLKNLRPVR